MLEICTNTFIVCPGALRLSVLKVGDIITEIDYWSNSRMKEEKHEGKYDFLSHLRMKLLIFHLLHLINLLTPGPDHRWEGPSLPARTTEEPASR